MNAPGFSRRVERLATPRAAFKSSRMTEARWCHPKLTVVVKHLAGSKMLRHATVRGFAQRQPAMCPYSNRPLIKIDHYGEILEGCIHCNRWGHPGDENHIMELMEDDLDALRRERDESS